jgi:hypothetical protein
MKQITALCLFLSSLLVSNKMDARNTETRTRYSKKEIGLKLGGNFDALAGMKGAPYLFSYHGGVYAEMKRPKFGLQCEALVKSVHYNYPYNQNYGLTGPLIENLYIDFPLLLQFRIAPMAWFQIGPQYSLLINSEFQGDGKATHFFKSGSVYAVAGIQIHVSKSFSIGGRYLFGLSDQAAFPYSSELTWKMRSVQFYLGLRLK